MRIVHVNTAYPEYLALYRARHREREALPFAEQQRHYYADAFGWADAWTRAMGRLGHEMWNLTLDMEPMQRAWARERGVPEPDRIGLDAIVAHQVAAFRPDVLFYNHGDARLLAHIRSEVPSVRLVLGWSGSALPDLRALQGCDVVLSCAQEAVDFLRSRGMRAEQLHHAFDPAVLEALGPRERPPAGEVFFSGQILIDSQYHRARHRLLASLHARGARLRVYTDSFRVPPRPSRALRETLRWLACHTVARPVLALRPGALPRVAKYRDGRTLADVLGRPAYRDRVAPAVYGLDMYRAIAAASVALNVHADSSPRFASNMRLFEIAGAGACLLTDAKENLASLFEPDREVVSYASVEECAEKALWLLEHPERCAEIARAGQARTLRDHTFDERAPELLAMIEKRLR